MGESIQEYLKQLIYSNIKVRSYILHEISIGNVSDLSVIICIIKSLLHKIYYFRCFFKTLQLKNLIIYKFNIPKWLVGLNTLHDTSGEC